MEDKELIKRMLNGDELALEALHKRYARQIYHYIYTETSDYDAAEEILQEVFYKVATKIRHFKQRSSFKTWIYVITRHAIIDYYRKQETQLKTVPLEDETMDYRGGAGHGEQLSELQYLINQLPLKYRRIMHLRYVEEFSLLDTARITGVSVMSVKSTQKRAKKMLKTQRDEGVAYNG